MEIIRGYRKTRTGIVTSDKMDKTVTVAIKTKVRHPLYGKMVNRTRKFTAPPGRWPRCRSSVRG